MTEKTEIIATKKSKTEKEAETRIENKLSCPLYILDASLMKDVIENKSLNNPLFMEILKNKQLNKPIKVLTTTAAFNRAIYLSNEKSSFLNIKLLLSLLEFQPSTVNFKDVDLVFKELVNLTQMIRKGEL